MAKTPQAIAYHVRAVTGGRHRTLGTVFIASSDAPDMIRGQYIFYRNTLERDRDLVMQRDQTTGFSKAVYDRIKADGVKYVVAQSKESGRMLITHVDRFLDSRNYGQGLQARADIESSKVITTWPRLSFPTAINSVDVLDEEPTGETLPIITHIEKPQKGATQKCGCYYVNGQIEQPCLDHAQMWHSVMEAKRKAS